jgi:hypothetical protein
VVPARLPNLDFLGLSGEELSIAVFHGAAD